MKITLEVLAKKYGFNIMGNMAVMSMKDGVLHWSGGYLTIAVYQNSEMSVLAPISQMAQIDPIMHKLGFRGQKAKASKIIVPKKKVIN